VGGAIVGATVHLSRPYARWKDAAAAEARAVWAGRPPLEGPVEVRLLAVLPAPLSARKLAGAPRTWAARKPDVDNVAKAVLDALTDAAIWGDDAQVVALTVHRCWGAVQERARGADVVAEEGHIDVVVLPADGSPGRW
jgi:crossover junction endodeoxyribonuclease RusA